MTDTKVPFGYHIETGRIVDVREVPSGVKCGCTCPGCDLPLIGRRCMVGRVDHFAHNTRGQDKKVLEECTFSFWVSIAAMARQIFQESDGLDISMPAYTHPNKLPWEGFKPDFLCSEALTINLEDISVDAYLFGEHFDVIGKFHGVPVGVRLVHPEKNDAGDFSEWDYHHQKGVVISVDLSHLRAGFQHSQVTLKEVLANLISKEVESKSWIYHPRMDHYQRNREKIESGGRTIDSVRGGSSQNKNQSSRRMNRDNLGNSGLYRNENGEFLFYCRRCDHQVLKNDSQCFCCRCGGVMYRIHRGQVNAFSS